MTAASASRWAAVAIALALTAACGTTQDAVHPAATDAAPVVTQSARVGDFVRTVTYLDDHGQAMGMRWVHAEHGLPVTVLSIQSVPQVFLYVNTPPVSDRGEPHTGEHLLLGKGRKGKMLAGAENASLIGSTAWTSQSDVVYAWNCAAGKETFFASVERYLDALLRPDYTDEEIRREVMNLGVKQDAETGRLALEEKGTIYNEMVSTYQKRWTVWNRMRQRVWGAQHPLGSSSGGEPAAIRTMEPHHIRDFHRACYHLSENLGMIVALPQSIPDRELLERLSGMMAALDALPELAERPKVLHSIPPAQPEAGRSLELVPFPSGNDADGGVAIFSWSPVTMPDQRARVLSEVLLATVGEGQTATLYKRLMDSSTREVEVDASAMFAWLESTKIDSAPMFAFDGFASAQAEPGKMDELLGVFHDEIRTIAAMEVGSEALAAFNGKALVQLDEWEQELRKQLNAPPLFGYRGEGGFWIDHLRLLDLDPSAERSVTLAPVFAELRADLAAGGNPWSGVVERLGVLGAPFVTVSVASTEELGRLQAESAARIQTYTRELQERYELDDEQGAIAAYLGEYEKNSAAIAASEEGLTTPPLVDDVPLNSDPLIVLEPLEGLLGHRGVFDNATFVEVSVALDLHGIRPDDYPWLAVLPSFLTDAGAVVDGEHLAYDEVESRRGREIYSLGAEYIARASKERHELRLTATGLDPEAADRAVTWLERALFSSWIAPDNVQRLRDLVAVSIRSTRGTLGGQEERWVRNPANSLRFQHDPLFLSIRSHYTKLFSLARIEWLLMEPPVGDDAKPVATFLAMLPTFARADREATQKAIADVMASDKITPDVRARWIDPIGARVNELVGDMAPGAIAKDLGQLANVIRDDLAVTPTEALDRFKRLHRRLTSGRAQPRFVVTGSRANTDALMPRLTALAGRFSGPDTREADPYARLPQDRGIVRTRLADHQEVTLEPVHHALVWGAGTSGVFVFSADAHGLDDLGAWTLTRELAARAFGGSGAHGFFMQTWGAGLAYSNGIGASAQGERISYYAERCPDLVETMKLVTGLVAASDGLPDLAEYCVTQTVGHSRAGDRYETRTRVLADEIVDGDGRERVEAYRLAVLALRQNGELWDDMKGSVQSATGRVLPGVGPRSRDVAGGTFLVIAPHRLIEGWERWVRDHEGAEERYRIYPRDFWIVP